MREIDRATIPSWQLSVRAGDSYGFGRRWARRNVANVVMKSGKLTRGTRCELENGAYRWISLGRA